MAIEKKELHKEKLILNKVFKLLDSTLEDLKKDVKVSSEDLVEFKKLAWSSSSSFDSGDIVQAKMMTNEEENKFLMKQNYLKRLIKIKDKPYFASIVFKDTDGEIFNIYLSLTYLKDKHSNNILYDWRSPICSLFYDYETGPCSYNAPIGEIKGELLRKRQYKIEDKSLVSVFDNSLNIDDDVLQEVLATESSEQMKNIVNTIQQEQNKVIRNLDDKNLIVQGIAGSGKTSVALHRIAAYSNFAYLADFSEGNKKIVSGKMITKSSSDNEIVISKSLANKNNLKVGDEIEFNLPNNDDEKLKFKIVGIYSNTSEKNSNNFIEINALNEANQIYTNLSSIESILSKQSDTSDKLIDNNGLDVKIYLNKKSDLSKFKKEVKQKGLSSYYKITTNKNQIKESLKPIENISKFSINFLIVVLVLGVIILSVINILNIRDRKYEIGVLRAIGMSKQKITLQFIYETLIISLFSLVIGTCIGLTIMKPITNKILESEINSYQEKITNNEINFGEGDFRKTSEQIDRDEFKDIKNKNMKQDNNITYVDSLKVKLDFTTILELFGISILLAVCSTAISSIIINKYNPNKILQNRT